MSLPLPTKIKPLAEHVFVRWTQDPDGLLVALAFVALSIGSWLLLPWKTLEAEPYAPLLRIGFTDLTLGLAFVGAATLELLATVARNWFWRRFGAVLLGCLFGLLFGATAIASPSLLGVPVYGTLTLLTLWSIVGLGIRRGGK